MTGLRTLCNLQTLSLDRNKIESIGACEEILHVKSLVTLNLRENLLTDFFKVLRFLEIGMAHLLYLTLEGNPLGRTAAQQRREIILLMPQLVTFDGRLVEDIDRRMAEAYKAGGLEAEQAARNT